MPRNVDDSARGPDSLSIFMRDLSLLRPKRIGDDAERQLSRDDKLCELVENNLPMAIGLAKRFGRAFALEDAISVANLALVEAAWSFDPDGPSDRHFGKHAFYQIQRAFRVARNASHVVHVSSAHIDASHAYHQGKVQCVEDLEKLGVSPHLAPVLWERLTVRSRDVSLDQLAQGERELQLSDASRMTPEEECAELEVHAGLNAAMQSLSDDERVVLTARFVDPDDGPMPTHAELAQRMGIYERHVKAIEAEAVMKLRQKLTVAAKFGSSIRFAKGAETLVSNTPPKGMSR